MEDDVMLTTAEAAAALGVSGPYLTRLLDAGRLPYRMTGDQPLIPLAAVRAFLAERDRRLHELARLATAEKRLACDEPPGCVGGPPSRSHVAGDAS